MCSSEDMNAAKGRRKVDDDALGLSSEGGIGVTVAARPYAMCPIADKERQRPTREEEEEEEEEEKRRHATRSGEDAKQN